MCVENVCRTLFTIIQQLELFASTEVLRCAVILLWIRKIFVDSLTSNTNLFKIIYYFTHLQPCELSFVISNCPSLDKILRKFQSQNGINWKASLETI